MCELKEKCTILVDNYLNRVVFKHNIVNNRCKVKIIVLQNTGKNITKFKSVRSRLFFLISIKYMEEKMLFLQSICCG